MEYINSDEGLSQRIGQRKGSAQDGGDVTKPSSVQTQLFPSFFAHFPLALQTLWVMGLKTQVDFWHVIKIFLRARVVMVDKVPISESYPQFSFIETNGNNSGSI